MRKICSFCNVELVCKDRKELPGVVHGICKECAEKLQNRELYGTVTFLMNKVKEPALLIENGEIITMANRVAKDVLGGRLEGELPGDAVGCLCAALAGGCGKTKYCGLCSIRNTLGDVFSTGVSSSKKVMQDVIGPQGASRRIISFTMELAGEAVLLTVNDIESVIIAAKDVNKNLCWQIVDE